MALEEASILEDFGRLGEGFFLPLLAELPMLEEEEVAEVATSLPSGANFVSTFTVLSLASGPGDTPPDLVVASTGNLVSARSG